MWLYNPNGFFFLKGKLENRRFGNKRGPRGGRTEPDLWARSGGGGGPGGQDSGAAAPQVSLLGKCKPRKGRWGQERS